MKITKSSAVPTALVIVFLGGAVVGRVTANRPPSWTTLQETEARGAAGAAAPALSGSFLSGVPDVRQSTGYSCGPAALQAVLAYWGIAEREDSLIARLHSTPQLGTHPDDIVRGARELGLRADLRENLALDDLEAALKKGVTVIVDLQAWRGHEDKPWTEIWDDGHYMVLIGMDAHNLYFEDPSLLGVRGYIPRQEFLDRWHDYEGNPPPDVKARKYVQTAIFIRGERPADRSRFELVK
jgi:predicted double-glycine peptidase